MATEMSAFCAIIAPDEQVFAALEGRPFAPHGAAWDAAVAQWRGLASHPDARFDRAVTVDAAEVAPLISWGYSPKQGVSLHIGRGSDREKGDECVRILGVTGS